MCKGITATGKICSLKDVKNGYCAIHSANHFQRSFRLSRSLNYLKSLNLRLYVKYTLITKINELIENDLIMVRENPQTKHYIKKNGILATIYKLIEKKDLYHSPEYYIENKIKECNEFKDIYMSLDCNKDCESVFRGISLILAYVLSIDDIDEKMDKLYRIIKFIGTLNFKKGYSRKEILLGLINILELDQELISNFSNDCNICNLITKEENRINNRMYSGSSAVMY